MLSIDTTGTATKEISKAIDWYEDRQDGLGEHFLRSLNRLLRRIAGEPHEYMFVTPKVQRAIMKKYPYKIFFTVENHMVVILRVRHNKQRPLKRYR